jgi:Arm DNA-binding domain
MVPWPNQERFIPNRKAMEMSARKRKWRDKHGRVQEKWMIHIEYTNPDGSRQTIRKVSPVQTKRGAEQYEREVRQALLDGVFGRSR